MLPSWYRHRRPTSAYARPETHTECPTPALPAAPRWRRGLCVTSCSGLPPPVPRSPAAGAGSTLAAEGNVLHAVTLDRLLRLIKRRCMLLHPARTTIAACNSAPTLSIAPDSDVALETIPISPASVVAN